MVTSTSRRGLEYIKGVLHHTMDGLLTSPAACAYTLFPHGDCAGPIREGEGFVAVMPLGVMHLAHVDLIQIEPGA